MCPTFVTWWKRHNFHSFQNVWQSQMRRVSCTAGDKSRTGKFTVVPTRRYFVKDLWLRKERTGIFIQATSPHSKLDMSIQDLTYKHPFAAGVYVFPSRCTRMCSDLNRVYWSRIIFNLKWISRWKQKLLFLTCVQISKEKKKNLQWRC